MDAMDDVTAAMLYSLQSKVNEEIGLVYRGEEGVQLTPSQSKGRSSKSGGHFKIPAGSLLGLYHNHPRRKGVKGTEGMKDDEGEVFSPDDRRQSRELGVPSYIITPTGRVLKFDPKTDKVIEVLAQIPVRSSGAHNVLVK